MRILEVSRLLRRNGLAVFTSRELSLLLPREDRRVSALQLHQWNRKGWVVRLRRGVYELAFPEPGIVPDLHLANRIYEPSYVSLETALSRYQIIPETAAQVTSVTPMPTRRFLTPRGLFTYMTIRPGAFAGYRLDTEQGVPVRIAEPEKAVVDRLYAGMRRGEPLRPLEDRWDRGKLRRLDRRKLAAYARLFGAGAPRLMGRLNALV